MLVSLVTAVGASDDQFGQPDEVENSALFGTSKKGGLFDDDDETESAAAAAPKEEVEPVVTRERSGTVQDAVSCPVARANWDPTLEPCPWSRWDSVKVAQPTCLIVWWKRVYRCTHVHTCVYMYIHVYTCTYMCIHVHTCVYMYMHCTYMYMYTLGMS